MNPFTLALEALPAWHTYAFDAERPAVVLRTHPAVHQALVDDLANDAFEIADARTSNGYGAWAPPRTREAWGFPGRQAGGRAEPFRIAADGWTVWRFPLPRIGLREPARTDWDSAYALSSTLSMFFVSLDRSVDRRKPEDFGSRLQLLNVSMSIQGRSLHSAPIGATLSKETVTRLSRHGITPEVAEGVKGAMRTAVRHLWGGSYGDVDRHFEVWCDPPDNLHMYMPLGNAVGLDPEWHRLAGYGYHLNGHNIDSPLHQLTLLAGLARLHEHLARLD